MSDDMRSRHLSSEGGAGAGAPTKRECREALEAVYAYLDGELPKADADHIRQHLEDCRPCLEEYEVDRLLKVLVRRSCLQERAPAALRTQIMGRIQTTSLPWASGGAGILHATTQTTVVEIRGLTE